MELLDGESLAARLKRDPSMSVEAAVAIVQPIGAAVGALHAKGILHRDVKPSNIVLVQQGDQIIPKLLDLGAGKEVGATEEATATGLAIGSPHYMAPEQAAGRKDIDARVDQYALGVLTYQLLTGARPYENDDTGHVLAKVLAGVPYKLPHELRSSISPDLEEVVLKAMARSREDRYPSVEAFMAALGSRLLRRPAAVAVPPPIALEDSTRVAPLMEPVAAAHEPTGTMRAAVVSGPVQTRSQVLVWISLGLAVVLAGGVALLRFHRPSSAPSAVTVSTPSAAPEPPPPASTAPPGPDVPAPPIVPPAAVSSEPAPPSAVPPPPEVPTPPPAPPRPSATPRPRAPASHATAAAPCRPTPGSPCL